MQGVTEVYKMAVTLCPDGEEGKLTLCAAAAEQEVKAYCGLDALPEELYFLTARLAVSLYQGDGGEVRALSRGDYSVTYGEGTKAQLKAALQPYRKVRW